MTIIIIKFICLKTHQIVEQNENKMIINIPTVVPEQLSQLKGQSLSSLQGFGDPFQQKKKKEKKFHSIIHSFIHLFVRKKFTNNNNDNNDNNDDSNNNRNNNNDNDDNNNKIHMFQKHIRLQN